MTRAGWLLLALPVSAFAGTPEIIDAVEAKYAGVETLTAKFTQTTKSELYGADEQSGTMSLMRPAKMRWVFAGDGKQFVTDGSTMWIYNPADNQVLKYSDVSQSAASADSLLQSLDRISELFEVELLEDTKTVKRLSLKPKAADAQVKRIELALDGDLVIQNVTILDAFDTSTALAFQNVALDSKLPEGTFTFEVPKGAEVISAN
ncbi:MAG: outer membrane lipoprotein carrier protein LolA [Myxococcota bacterium]